MRRAAWAWIAAGVITATGLWCTRGVLDIASDPQGIVRVAMLPPVWLLGAAIVVLATAGMFAQRAGRSFELVAPACALIFLGISYLPWIPDRLPVLRIGAGPGRSILWLIVGGLTVGRFVVLLFQRVHFRRPALLVFLASATVYGAVAWRLSGSVIYPGGDEPHYLVITQSLLHDGDFKIENNHQREEYRAYFNAPLKPDYLARGVDGQIYSVHPVGLPILAVPAFAIAGYRGVVAMLILMAAFAATILWKRASEITGSPTAATIGWAAVALTAPFVFNAIAVYPEIPAALAVTLAIAWRRNSTTTMVAIVRGIAIGSLPWLSTKYAPMAAVLAVIAVADLRRSPKKLAALAVPLLILLTAWFEFFHGIWGTFSPSAPYGSFSTTTIGMLIRGAPGLLFDQEYGLVAHAPVLIIAIAGLTWMTIAGRTMARMAIEIAMTFFALLVTVGAYRLWWGGSAVAGRPLTSAVLLLGLPIAWVVQRLSARSATRVVTMVLLVASLCVVVLLAVSDQGRLLHNDRDGSSTLLDWMSPTWPVWSAFPSFLAGSLLVAWAKTAAWIGIFALAVAATYAAGRRSFGASSVVALSAALACGATIISIVTAHEPLPIDRRPEARSRVALLDEFDRKRLPTTIVFDPWSRRDPSDLLSRSVLVARPASRTAPQPVDLLWNARFALPAGEYRLDLTAAPIQPDARVALQIGRVGSPLVEWPMSTGALAQQFTLPVDAEFVGFRTPATWRPSTGELRLTPIQIVDAHLRPERPPVLSTVQYGAATVFFHDDNAFPEAAGYWIRGGSTTAVTYSLPDSRSTIDLTVRCGGVSNRISLMSASDRQTVDVPAGEERRVTIPFMALAGLSTRIAPLSISVKSGFFPANSADRRYLGCWVEGRTFFPQISSKKGQRTDGWR